MCRLDLLESEFMALLFRQFHTNQPVFRALKKAGRLCRAQFWNEYHVKIKKTIATAGQMFEILNEIEETVKYRYDALVNSRGTTFWITKGIVSVACFLIDFSDACKSQTLML